MSISIKPSFKLILDEVKKNCTSECLLNRHDFKEILSATNSIEKHLIAKIFCQLPWNIGSLRVLALLQELRILTATEFILSIPGNDHIQLILNDFLEAEFELLANLFISSVYDSTNSMRLNEILDQSTCNLFNDLLQNPNLNDLSYLSTFTTLLPNDILKRLAIKYLDIILDLHKSNMKTAISNFSLWINKGVNDITFTKTLQQIVNILTFFTLCTKIQRFKLLSASVSLIKEIIDTSLFSIFFGFCSKLHDLFCNFEQDVLNHLFKMSTRDYFKSWKFYLILLQTIASSCKIETSAFIRRYIKTRIQEVASSSSYQCMLHLLLTARTITALTTDIQKNIDAYAEWYRQNIGEMKFVLKTAEFQNFCALLEECIQFEMEEDYLDVHATISISPPVLCGKIVQNYKAKCKFRLMQIKKQNSKTNESCIDNNSIVIDSD